MRFAPAHGLELARTISAKATAITVTPSWRAIALSEIAVGHLEEEYAARTAQYAAECLGKVQQAADEYGVMCETLQVSSDRPYEAIITAAKQNGCDLIVVGAHGRRGIIGLLLGSETVKVLTHSKIPVLVFRE